MFVMVTDMVLQHLVDYARWINSALAFIGLLWLGIRSWIRRDSYSEIVRLYLMTVGFFAFSVAYGSLEMALQHAPPGFRSLPTAVANLALLITLALTQPKQKIMIRGDDNGV